MGGTSTDVSRFDGNYEHVFESTTAGILVLLLTDVFTCYSAAFYFFVQCNVEIDSEAFGAQE